MTKLRFVTQLTGHNPVVWLYQSSRNAVFIMPRIGTDELRAGILTGNIEVLVEPIFARHTQPFAAEAAWDALVFKYNPVVQTIVALLVFFSTAEAGVVVVHDCWTLFGLSQVG